MIYLPVTTENFTSVPIGCDKQKDSSVEKNKCQNAHIPNIIKFPSLIFFDTMSGINLSDKVAKSAKLCLP